MAARTNRQPSLTPAHHHSPAAEPRPGMPLAVAIALALLSLFVTTLAPASAAVVTIDDFQTGSTASVSVTTGQTSASTGSLPAASAIGGTRDLALLASSAMPSGESAFIGYSSAGNDVTFTHSANAPQTVYEVIYSTTNYDLAAALGTSAHQDYAFDVV